MEILTLIFSGPGATIFVCLTLLALVSIYLHFPDRFKDWKFGYKDIRVEMPTSARPPTKASAEIAEEPRPVAKNQEKGNGVDKGSRLFSLSEAIENRDRSAIEAAIENLRENPPHGFTQEQLEVIKFRELLRAGFSDALASLKEIEKARPNEVQASVYLARHYMELRAFENVETHLQIAEKRAKDDKQKRQAYLLRAAIIAFSNQLEAAKYLSNKVSDIKAKEERYNLFVEIGDLYKKAGNEAAAILAYEKALRCQPDYADTRFKLGLLYGEQAGLELLALRHYDIILKHRPNDTGAMNNLGLLYGDLKVATEKVRLIKEAARRGDGHALGNLASFYTEAGFVEEAEKSLDDVPEQIWKAERALAARRAIQEARTEAEKNKEKILTAAERVSTYVTSFNFTASNELEQYLGRWIGQDESVLSFDRTEHFYKIATTTRGDVRSGYIYDMSLITTVEMFKGDPPPRSAVELLGETSADGRIVLLFGDDRMRMIHIQVKDAIIMHRCVDYEREQETSRA